MASPDIFLSYNREDFARAKQFAEAFAADGLDVWWDVDLRSGEAYDEVTEAALREAKAVVVLWSPRSAVSRWVRAEATLADRAKTLLPAMIEPCERPIMFELVQTADLCHWQGDTGDTVWRDFARHVCAFVGRGAAHPVDRQPNAVLPRLDQISVIVLPFANHSRDEDQEYFADGITDDLITDLGKVPALSVIARNSAFYFKGRQIDAKDVARQMNVTHILEGSVRKAGNRVRVNAQLIDGSTGSQVWSERWDHDLEDIFELQDNLSGAIIKALKITLLPQEAQAISDRGTNNLEAYDLYQQAKCLRLSMDPSKSERMIDLLKQAVRLDPGFGQAWLGMVQAIDDLRMVSPTRGEALWPQALDAYRRVTSLRTDLPDTRDAAALLSIWENDWDSLAATVKSGKQFHISSSYALAILGRIHEALDLQLELCKADPLSSLGSACLQYWLSVLNRLDEAEAEYQRGRELPGVVFLMDRMALFRAMARKDDNAVFRTFGERLKGTFLRPYCPQMLEALGHPDRARAVLRQAMAEFTSHGGMQRFYTALWAAYLEDFDLAFPVMYESIVEHKLTGFLIELWAPRLAEMRRDPRFKELLRDTGLPDYWRRTAMWGDFVRPLGDDDFEVIA